MYDYWIGNGIIVPTSLFVKLFWEDIQKQMEDPLFTGDYVELMTQVVKKHINENFECQMLGSDAFESRSGRMGVLDILGEVEGYQDSTAKIAKMWLEDEDPHPLEDFMSELMFIGICETVMDNTDLSWYVKGPEILYSLPAALKRMTQFYMQHHDKQLNFGEKYFDLFGQQESKIWTFHNDIIYY